MHHDFLLTKWEIPLPGRSQSGDAGDPTLCQGAAPLTRLPWITPGYLVMIRLSGLTIRASAPSIWISREVFTLFTVVCLCLVLHQRATGFCTGQTEPGTSSYLIQKKCSWNECICRKGVFISNNWHFVMTVALVKSSWPSLIFIENFIEWFFCFWIVFHSLSCAYTLVKHQAQRGHNPTWGFYMWRSVTLIVVHIKCVSLSGTEIAALLLSSRRSD